MAHVLAVAGLGTMLSGLVPWAVAWRCNARTTLRPTLAWALAASNSFEWSLLVSAGAGTLFYGVVCAAVLRLRYLRPGGARFRLPFGPLFSVTGVAICLALLGDLDLRKALLMSITALVAGLNWWWARRRAERSQEAVRLRIPQPEASVNPE